jgi:hypothetical protein
MELRRDPITQSWVVLGHRDVSGDSPADCPFEPAALEKQSAILSWPPDGPWQVRVLPHPEPLYRIEGIEVGRQPPLFKTLRAMVSARLKTSRGCLTSIS